MTPEEELKRLNRLLRQYETVYHTTPDADQRARAERQIKEMRSYRDKLLAVHVIESTDDGEVSAPDPLEPYPLLIALRAQNASESPREMIVPVPTRTGTLTASQEEMFNLSLYVRRFEREFLPFLTEKQLKLDFTHSMDRDAFYGNLQSLRRLLNDYHEEHGLLADGMARRDMELEMRKRTQKLARFIAVEAARFFRALGRFAETLTEDATGDAVKCLNCDDLIDFDAIEGTRVLQGCRVSEGLEELAALSAEVVAYLNVPEIEIQESERADRR